MTVLNTNLVLKNITRFGGRFTKTVNDTMEQVSKLLDRQVDSNISLGDHTLKQLSELDHPYAGRHGSQGLEIHNPYWLIHEQSGQLKKSQKSGVQKASVNSGTVKATAFVGFDDNQAPHALWLVFGTSKMIPRPVLEGSRDQVKAEALAFINDRLRNAVGSFR